MTPYEASIILNKTLHSQGINEKITLEEDWKTIIRLTNQASRYSDLLTQQDKFEQASEIETAIGVILESLENKESKLHDSKSYTFNTNNLPQYNATKIKKSYQLTEEHDTNKHLPKKPPPKP